MPWRRKRPPLQYSCLGYSMDRGAWWATVHGVAKSWTTERPSTHIKRKKNHFFKSTGFFYFFVVGLIVIIFLKTYSILFKWFFYSQEKIFTLSFHTFQISQYEQISICNRFPYRYSLASHLFGTENTFCCKMM